MILLNLFAAVLCGLMAGDQFARGPKGYALGAVLAIVAAVNAAIYVAGVV